MLLVSNVRPSKTIIKIPIKLTRIKGLNHKKNTKNLQEPYRRQRQMFLCLW